MRRRWRGFAASVVAVGLCCCLGLVAVVSMVAHAALPGAVKVCEYSGNFTHAKPCTTDLYVGEYMTYECASGHTTEPASAQGTGKYCATALTDSGSCTDQKTLDADIGGTKQDGAKVVLRLKEEYTTKFSDVINYNIRCVDGNTKMFVTVKLWPFTRPLEAKPNLVCTSSTETGTTADIRCNFFAFKSDAGGVDCREGGQTAVFIPADAHTNGTGKVCTIGFASQAAPACGNGTEATWGTIAPGSVITSRYTAQGFAADPSRMTVDRAVVYVGCARSGGGGATMFTKGMLLKNDFVAINKSLVPMIKHICTPEKGKTLSKPCEATLAADEAAVVVCADFVTSPKYKLMPADVSQPGGSFCTAMPSSFKADCTGKAKWSDEAKADVAMDATMDYFLVAMPAANLKSLTKQVTAYGYCSDETKGLAFKFTMGSGTTTTTKPDNGGSGATPVAVGGAVMGFVTLVTVAVTATAVL